MEMTTGALLLLLVSGVCASPYGYGVKGGAGAAAKAEARAVAGAYSGEAPIQPGSGFSGSYSKSSSSSFASSSASSSASSFSFSGSAPAGFDQKNLGNGGCATGSCQNDGDKTGSHYGSAPSSLSGANAGAFAGATAGSVTFPKINGNCGDKDCSNDNTSPCNGEGCSNNIKKCISGQCSSSLDDGSNDISSNAQKTSESEGNSALGCTNGNCGSTTPYHTGSQSKNHINQYSSTAGTTASPVYSNPPSTYLQTSKQPCDSPNCGTPKGEPPSSYNVPISSVISEPSKPCTHGNCDKQASAPSSDSGSNQYLGPSCTTPNCGVKPPTNYVQPPYADVSSDCGSSGACGTGKTDDYDIGPVAKTPKIPTPSYTLPKTANTPGLESPPSYLQTSPHIPIPSKTPQPSYTNLPGSDKEPSFVALNGPIVPVQNQPAPHLSSPSYAFGSTAPVRPSYAPVIIHTNTPHLTGGYQEGTFGVPVAAGSTGSGYAHTPSGSGCGPSGCGSPSGYPSQFQITPSYGLNQQPCRTPGCKIQTGLGANEPPKPPPYLGGFGGPSGLLKPNQFTGSSNVPLNQKPASEINPVSTSPGYLSTAPVGCTSGNCNIVPGYGGNVGSTVPCQSGNCNSNNAGNFGTGTSSEQIVHSPGVESIGGGPNNCASGNCNQLSNHNDVATGSHISGHGGIVGNPTPCTSGNCNQAPNYSAVSGGSGSGGYGGTVGGPSQCKSGNCNQASNYNVATTGSSSPGYGGIVGNQIPNHNAAATAGSSSPGYGGILGNPSHCPSGNCNQIPNHNAVAAGSNGPGYGGIVGNPSPCTSGNCNQISHHNAAATTGSNSAGYGGIVGNPSHCASGNCNQIPNHNAVAAGSNGPGYGGIVGNPSPCTSGNCNQISHHNAVATTGSNSAGYGGIVGNPSHCASGNCNQIPNHNAVAAGSNSPGYGSIVGNPNHCASGNCNQVPNHNAEGVGSHSPVDGGIVGRPATCTSGNCNQKSIHHGGAAGSAASSAASANAVAYTGGFGGPPGLLTPYDDGKLVGKDAGGKLLASSESGGQYSASLFNGANTGVPNTLAAGYGGGLNDDVHEINAHESGKHSACNSGCGGHGSEDGNAAASAKAYAGAASAAGAKGYGGAFAGSSASAHASSGAHIKGGYSGR